MEEATGKLTSHSGLPGKMWSELLVQAPFHLCNVTAKAPNASHAVYLRLRDAAPTEPFYILVHTFINVLRAFGDSRIVAHRRRKPFEVFDFCFGAFQKK